MFCWFEVGRKTSPLKSSILVCFHQNNYLVYVFKVFKKLSIVQIVDFTIKSGRWSLNF